MTWLYNFVNLSDAEKLQRRELLDWYGGFAQLSAVLPLLVLQGYYVARWLRTWASGPKDLDTPSSPRVKEARGSAISWRVRVRRARWWLGGSVVIGGDLVGCRGEVLGAVSWGVWLFTLCFLDTGRDYLHLTKRFGAVASSQLPLHYLLALKSPYSPLQYLTGRSHESLNILHQLLGRVITILFYAHVALYVSFYVQSNLLTSKLKEAYVVCGIIGVIAFTAVGTTALAPVRRWSYRVFYITHVVLASALLPILFFHVSHIRVYLYETTVVYAINVILRSLSSHTTTANIKLLDSGALVEVIVPLLSDTKKALRKFQPGQHAYLSLQGHPASRTFRSNPFSLASIPSADGGLRFVARVLDGNTAKFAEAAKSGLNQDLTIEGPYGLPSHAEKLLQYDRVLFVAGGIGGTFIVPLYRQLLADLSPSWGSYRRQKVSFAWVARRIEDVVWAVPAPEKDKLGFLERSQIWNTCLGERGPDSGGAMWDTGGWGEQEDGIELQESKGLLSDADGLAEGSAFGDQVHAGRPNLRGLLDLTFTYSSSERVAVLVCGPRSLSKEMREEVGKYVRRGRDVWFWDESFSL